MNFHIRNKLCCLVVLVIFGFCRKAMGQVVDVGELMVRKDLTLQQIETIAENHFKIAGKGKGSGYKVFERWRYEQKFHLDQNGYILHPEREFLAFEYAKRILDKDNNKERAVANWTEMGPKSWAVSSGWNPGVGRLTSVAVHPSNTAVIYVGSPGGGIWKSTNSGAAWTPLIDNVNSAWLDVYSLCITPSNQNVVYAGISYDGVIKSSNAGATWGATGTGPYDIRKILAHPTNASIVLVAASNGIWRSANAGTSWTLVNGTTSAVDIEFKANDPNIVLASFSSNIISRSTNNGVSWASIPLAASGRTMLGVSPNNPDIVYAVQAKNSVFGRFYKSTDAGLTFTSLITGDPVAGTNFFGYSTNGKDTIGQAWYDMAICVNPTNVNEVHIAGIICWKSTNGGTSFIPETEWLVPNNTGYNHADVHSLEYINSTIYSTSDGGIYKSTNNGDDWTDLSSGLGIRQFYRIACAKTNANMITAGAQDNGSTYRQSGGNWLEWLGADGMDGIISPTNPSIAIGTSQNGSIYKTTNAGASYTNLDNPSDGNWITPLAIHPTNHDTIYGGWKGIYRSDNGGTSWNIISGATITNKLECLVVAPSNTRYIYGSIGSTLYRTSNAGATWTSVGASGAISSICVSPTNPQKIWITTTNSSSNVLVSSNAGTSWVNISAGLPAFAARSVVVDNTTNEGLYVGMNIGVYYRDNVNTAWIIHAGGLPLVEINEVELQLSSKKVRVATYGRGIWESDMQPSPTVNAGADVTVTCSNPSTTLTAINGVSYLWNTGATTASITVSPTLTTTYVVTATMSAGNKTSDAVLVTVNKTLPIADAGADVSVTCLSPTANLTATGGVSYLWNNGVITATNTVSPSLTTTYIVTVTATNGCTAQDSAVVYSNKAIPNLNLGADVTITPGFSVTFNANGGGTYLWSNGATTASITVSPIANSTIYGVTVTNSSACTASDAATVFVVPACANLTFSSPTIQGNKLKVNLRMNSCSAPFSIGANNIRFNYNKLALSNPVMLSDTFPSPDFGTSNSTGSSTSTGVLSINTTYNGTANANTLIIPTTGIDLVNMEFTILNPALSTGLTWRIIGATPKITLVDDDKTTAITNVTGVNLDNSLQGVNGGADVTVNCINTGTTLTASGSGNYLWSTGATTASINVSPTVTTTYRVTVTNGVMTAIDEIVVVADNLPPLASAGEDVTINCKKPNANLYASGGVNYVWSTGAITPNINVSPTVTTTYMVTVTGSNGCNAVDEVLVTYGKCNISIQPKVFLNHVNLSTLLMDNYVTTLADFPHIDPYSVPPLNTGFTHVNNSPVATITSSALAQTGNDAVMDWMFLELRTGVSGNTNVAYTKAALLQRDGDIVATDGVSPVEFIAPSGNYYVTVRHRNHLGFRTANTFSLSSIPKLLNFTNNSISLHGSNPLIAITPTLTIMNSGDATFDGSIDAFDTIIWEAQNGTFDNYSSNGDYNFDGSVDAFDTILWEINNGRFHELD